MLRKTSFFTKKVSKIFLNFSLPKEENFGEMVCYLIIGCSDQCCGSSPVFKSCTGENELKSLVDFIVSSIFLNVDVRLPLVLTTPEESAYNNLLDEQTKAIRAIMDSAYRLVNEAYEKKRYPHIATESIGLTPMLHRS